MYKGKKIYAVYRVLYGEDFIKESIESVLDHVDKVFVFWSNYTFGKLSNVLYKGEIVKFPNVFDRSIEIVKSINSDKIVLFNEHFMVNSNSFTKMYNEHILPDYDECDILMMLEVDHVFRKDQLELALDQFIDEKRVAATTEQWEIWKGFKHCVPQWNDDKVEFEVPNYITDERERSYLEKTNPRLRMCTMFINMEYFGILPRTGMHCNPVGIAFHDKKFRLKARTHNFGFAVSEKTMYWKHLVSIGIASKVNDDPPNEDWYDNKWKSWTPESENLEQSKGFEWHIPKCIPYDTNDLPKSIKDRFNL